MTPRPTGPFSRRGQARAGRPTRGIPVAPLFLAGFTTAFGAHGVAAALGTATDVNLGSALLSLAVALAVYDLAEIVLKPVFGSITDRVGPKPVILAGLAAFAAVSFAGIFLGSGAVILTRFGQGAAAAAFSPAASTAVARLADNRVGSTFGRYGAWKSLGYALGPVIGALLITLGGVPMLNAALALLAAATAIWVALAIPTLPPLPRQRTARRTAVRQLTARAFLLPTLVLAATTGALTAAIGFLPALGTHYGLSGLLASVTAVILAVASSTIQPLAGRALDRGHLHEREGLAAGTLFCAAGLALAAVLPSVAGVFVAALLVGVGVGVATPIAFAALTRATPPDRLGRTLGSAEVGRELGDIGGPALIGLVAAGAGLGSGLGALAAALTLTAAAAGLARSQRTGPTRTITKASVDD